MKWDGRPFGLDGADEVDMNPTPKNLICDWCHARVEEGDKECWNCIHTTFVDEPGDVDPTPKQPDNWGTPNDLGGVDSSRGDYYFDDGSQPDSQGDKDIDVIISPKLADATEDDQWIDEILKRFDQGMSSAQGSDTPVGDAKQATNIAKAAIVTHEAAAVAEARIEGAANILKIFQRNHGLSDAQYADMMTTVSSWKLQARQTPATKPKSQPEETNQKQHPDDWMQYGMEL